MVTEERCFINEWHNEKKWECTMTFDFREKQTKASVRRTAMQHATLRLTIIKMIIMHLLSCEHPKTPYLTLHCSFSVYEVLSLENLINNVFKCCSIVPFQDNIIQFCSKRTLDGLSDKRTKKRFGTFETNGFAGR